MLILDYILGKLSSLLRVASGQRNIAVGATEGAAQLIDVRGFGTGIIHIPSGSSLTTITVYECGERDGTYQPLRGGTNSAVTLTVTAGTARCFPDELYACDFIKLVGNVAASCPVHFKS